MRINAKLLLSLSLAFALGSAWATWHMNEDLYMSLCSGRDVLNGRLGTPDQWSFITHGKVWIEQEWLSGVFYYLSYKYLQELGPVLIKGFFLLALLPGLFWRCRQVGASWEAALLATILGIFSIYPFVHIRAENFALVYFVLTTALVSAPRTVGLVRQCSVVLIMLIWSNSHGSFMLGLCLISTKAFLETIRYLFEVYGIRRALRNSSIAAPGNAPESVDHLNTERNSGVFTGTTVIRGVSQHAREAWKWSITAVICFLIVAFANPFGLANLLLPFRQIGSSWTATVPVWRSPLRFDETSGIALSSKGDLRFLFMLLVDCIAVVLMVALRGARQSAAILRSRAQAAAGDMLMEMAICLVTVAMVFRFARAISFASLGMIGLTAFLLQSCVAVFGEWAGKRFPGSRLPQSQKMGIWCSLAVLLASFYLFRVQTLPKLLPQNPMTEDTSVIQRIFGHMTHLEILGKFLENNQMPGRVFSPMILSDVLLLVYPEVRVFIDSRAQSIYSGEADAYYHILFVNPKDQQSCKRALQLLDKYEIPHVVLTLYSMCGPLASVLSSSGKWLPLYTGPEGTVFVRRGSEKLKPFFERGTLNYLWYPDDQSKALSAAALSLEVKGYVPSEIQNALKFSVIENPLNRVYEILYLANLQQNGCLNEETRLYLISELDRLLNSDLMRPNGARCALQSMHLLLGFLEQERSRCSGGNWTLILDKKRADLAALESRLKGKFLPTEFLN